MADYQVGDTVTLIEKSTGSTLVREVEQLPFSGPGVRLIPGGDVFSIIKLTSSAWEITEVKPKEQTAPAEDGLYFDPKSNIFFFKDGNSWKELTYGGSDDGGLYPVWQTIEKAYLDISLRNGLIHYVRADAVAQVVGDDVKIPAEEAPNSDTAAE